jgi:folate-binding protein YgfZ
VTAGRLPDGRPTRAGSPWLDRTGAVAGEPPDDQVAAHYGDPFREQRLLTERVALVDRSHRGVLQVTGPDRLGWLHSLTSQHLESQATWTSAEGLVLSPHGHIEHHFVLTDDGTTAWLDVEPDTAAALLDYLSSMVFLLRVEPRDVSAEWAVVSALGPELASRSDLRPPEADYAARPLPDGGFVRRMPWPGPVSADLVVPRGSLAGLPDRWSVPVAGHDAFEALRVASRTPRLGRETDHRTIPHELGWLDRAVHLDKGCYRGQETVARVHNLGRPPRRLVFLHLDGSGATLPAPGAPVRTAERQVGTVTTAARHFELGPIALAVVKRNTPDGAPLLAGDVAAVAEPVVAA